jgi:hypothetical protein
MPSAQPLKSHAFDAPPVLRALYTAYIGARQRAIRNFAMAPCMTNAKACE